MEENKNENETLGQIETGVSLQGAEVEKELARWIYYEDGHTFYCYDCCMKRVEEINKNREFAEDIDYDGGDECGYMEDYADQDYEVECEKCGKPLYSLVDC